MHCIFSFNRQLASTVEYIILFLNNIAVYNKKQSMGQERLKLDNALQSIILIQQKDMQYHN
jgi:hypothetical protein